MSDQSQHAESIIQSEHIGPNKTGDNIEAKRVAGYRWSPASAEWERDTGATPALASRLDDTADPVLYIGKAPIASATSSAVWQISKLDTSSGLIKTWADGDSDFNNIWDNRASLSYS